MTTVVNKEMKPVIFVLPVTPVTLFLRFASVAQLKPCLFQQNGKKMMKKLKLLWTFSFFLEQLKTMQSILRMFQAHTLF